MYGISIDDEPNAPVGTPATRRTIAIHWNWTTEYSTEQMASALGVRPETVRGYIRDGPTEAVEQQMETVESEVRDIAILELKEQLRTVGHRARTAKKPVKIYRNEDDEIEVRDVTDDGTGELLTKKPVPQDIQFLPDEEARYYARGEARNILEQLTDLVGAGEPDELNVSLDDLYS